MTQEQLQVTRRRFADLADVWHSQTDGKSMDRASFAHPAYRTIIDDLGAAAIPFILEDLRVTHGHWFAALRELSGDPSVDEAARNLREAEQAWLRWGRRPPKDT